MTDKRTCPTCDLHSSALYRGEGCPNGCNQPRPPAIEAFIVARIAEDEEIARSTVQWSPSWQDFTMDGELRDDENAGTIAMGLADEDRAHIARQDPRRTLDRCDALRKILIEHAIGVDPCDAHGPGFESITCSTVRMIAEFWRHHPDYRPEWAA